MEIHGAENVVQPGRHELEATEQLDLRRAISGVTPSMRVAVTKYSCRT
jgi:hypothetical protein